MDSTRARALGQGLIRVEEKNPSNDGWDNKIIAYEISKADLKNALAQLE